MKNYIFFHLNFPTVTHSSLFTFDAELIYGDTSFLKLDEEHMHTEVLGALHL